MPDPGYVLIGFGKYSVETSLLVFLVVHLWTFKFGTYYETTLDGEPVRDLARLVTEKFQSPWYAFGYTAIMLLLALHLRHGVWSSLQSLGAMTPFPFRRLRRQTRCLPDAPVVWVLVS